MKGLKDDEVYRELQAPQTGLQPVLVIPQSQIFKAFDAFLWVPAMTKWYPLQATINDEKELKPDLLKEFYDKCSSHLGHPAGTLEWYGVVPPHVARPRTNRFSFRTSDTNLEWARKNVKQMLIPIMRPFDALQLYTKSEQAVLCKMLEELLSQ